MARVGIPDLQVKVDGIISVKLVHVYTDFLKSLYRTVFWLERGILCPLEMNSYKLKL